MTSQKDKQSKSLSVPSLLAEIKRRFENNFCYFIVEGPDNFEGTEQLEKISKFVSTFKKSVVDREIHRDKQAGKLYLVIRFYAEKGESTFEEFYEIELPKDFSFTIYGTRFENIDQAGK